MPVVTNVEIGSTWIYGIAADPMKLRWYRAAARARVVSLLPAADPDGRLAADPDPRVREFSRLLLKIPEQTAGDTGAGCTGAPFDNSAWDAAKGACSKAQGEVIVVDDVHYAPWYTVVYT